MIGLLFGFRRGAGRAGMRKMMLIRLALLIPLLLAVFLLHVSGTALVAIRIARIAVIAVVVLVAGGLRGRRGGGPPQASA